MIKALTKKIWYDEELFSVVRTFSPTKYDDYILVERKETGCVHEDGSTPVEMILIHAQNEEFYPDTPKVRKIIAKIKQAKAIAHNTKQQTEAQLTNVWLDCVR